MDTLSLITYLKSLKGENPIKLYCEGQVDKFSEYKGEVYANDKFAVLKGESSDLLEWVSKNSDYIFKYHYEHYERNNMIPMFNYIENNIKIEPGVIMKENVDLGKDVIILNGTIINSGVLIGENTTIDVNVVVGENTIVGDNCYIGSNTIISGVNSIMDEKKKVRIGNNVVIGANVVIIEGVKIGDNVIIAPGSVVVSNLKSNRVVRGIPAKIVRFMNKTI